MNEKFESEKKRLQQEIDELKIQLALGKSDSVDYMEEKKAEFSAFVDQTKKRILGSGAPVTEKLTTAQTRLDELKVQLALGRMESADAYQSQREKIANSIDRVREHLGELGDSVDDDFHAAREGFSHQAEAFKTMLEGAALNIGAGVMLAKDEIKELFESTSDKLHHAKEMTVEEASEARKYVRERIERHRR